MWLSKKLAVNQRLEQEGAAADMGVTTITGGTASVMTRGEQRDLAVFAPGGVLWQPRVGDTVLVIRGGAGGLEHCVAAAEPTVKPPEGMSPGELYLYSSGGASIYLKGIGSVAVTGPVEMAGNLSVTGAVRLTGRVDISGSLYVNGEAYRPCRCG